MFKTTGISFTLITIVLCLFSTIGEAQDTKTAPAHKVKGILKDSTVDIENFHASKIEGSKENELYNNFAEVSNKAQKKIMDDLTQKYGAALINTIRV